MHGTPVMRAFIVRQPGGPEAMQLEELPVPAARRGEVLVDIAYCGCNWADVMVRTNSYPHPTQYPTLLGCEVSGHVRALGEGVTGLAIGQPVAACLPVDGGYAEVCAVPAQDIIPLPGDMPLDLAAAFPLQSLTAYLMLHEVARVTRGSTILVTAIGGGVGLCLTQLAVRAGCRVLGAVGTPGKERRPLRLGAEGVFTGEAFVDGVLVATGGRGVDAAFDSVGATTLDRAFDAIRKWGHVVSYGEASGRPFPNLWERMVPKSATLSRFHLGHVDPGSASWKKAVAEVLEALRDGELQMFIEEAFPLERAGDMHARLESRQVSGKLLLRVGGGA